MKGKDKLKTEILKNKLNLYMCEINGLAENVYILAHSLDEALQGFKKTTKVDPKSIRIVEEKIKIGIEE